MTWVEPTTQNTGNLITANIWNTEVIGNIRHVRDRYEEKWVPIYDLSEVVDRYARYNLTNDPAASFCTPSDFSSLQSAELIFFGEANQTITYSLYSNYGAINGSHTQYSVSLTGLTFSVSNNKLHAIDVSALFPDLAAGHICGMQLTLQSGTYHRVLGLRLRYLRS